MAAASKEFLDAYKAKFNTDPIIYAPFTYDAANILIASMQKADSTDPAKYAAGAAEDQRTRARRGTIEFDAKGDRKNAEITIFTMKAGKLEPLAIVQGGKSVSFADFMKGGASAPAQPAAPAPRSAGQSDAAPKK